MHNAVASCADDAETAGAGRTGDRNNAARDVGSELDGKRLFEHDVATSAMADDWPTRGSRTRVDAHGAVSHRRQPLTLPPSADGTVQVTAPDGATKRIRLPRIANSPEIALGNVVSNDLISVEVQTDVPDCVASAVGPVGAAGFSIVRARSDGIVHVFLLPEPGQWLMQLECGGVQRRTRPPAIAVSAKGEISTRSLHVGD
jgi:hypothetical protein